MDITLGSSTSNASTQRDAATLLSRLARARQDARTLFESVDRLLQVQRDMQAVFTESESVMMQERSLESDLKSKLAALQQEASSEIVERKRLLSDGILLKQHRVQLNKDLQQLDIAIVTAHQQQQSATGRRLKLQQAVALARPELERMQTQRSNQLHKLHKQSRQLLHEEQQHRNAHHARLALTTALSYSGQALSNEPATNSGSSAALAASVFVASAAAKQATESGQSGLNVYDDDDFEIDDDDSPSVLSPSSTRPSTAQTPTSQTPSSQTPASRPSTAARTPTSTRPSSSILKTSSQKPAAQASRPSTAVPSPSRPHSASASALQAASIYSPAALADMSRHKSAVGLLVSPNGRPSTATSRLLSPAARPGTASSAADSTRPSSGVSTAPSARLTSARAPVPPTQRPLLSEFAAPRHLLMPGVYEKEGKPLQYNSRSAAGKVYQSAPHPQVDTPTNETRTVSPQLHRASTSPTLKTAVLSPFNASIGMNVASAIRNETTATTTAFEELSRLALSVVHSPLRDSTPVASKPQRTFTFTPPPTLEALAERPHSPTVEQVIQRSPPLPRAPTMQSSGDATTSPRLQFALTVVAAVNSATHTVLSQGSPLSEPQLTRVHSLAKAFVDARQPELQAQALAQRRADTDAARMREFRARSVSPQAQD